MGTEPAGTGVGRDAPKALSVGIFVLYDTTMSDSLSYADRARKAISPSNLAVKALSIVAHHSSPQTIDDWPQVGSQRKGIRRPFFFQTNSQTKQPTPQRNQVLPANLTVSLS